MSNMAAPLLQPKLWTQTKLWTQAWAGTYGSPDGPDFTAWSRFESRSERLIYLTATLSLVTTALSMIFAF
ncbi:MAG: hypothetical protein AB7P49_18125 [Bdellovibrionales bacterium]